MSGLKSFEPKVVDWRLEGPLLFFQLYGLKGLLLSFEISGLKRLEFKKSGLQWLQWLQCPICFLKIYGLNNPVLNFKILGYKAWNL